LATSDGVPGDGISDQNSDRANANAVIQCDYIFAGWQDHAGPVGFVPQRKAAPKRRLSFGRAGRQTSCQQHGRKQHGFNCV
jgi:hypothetical protein